jgi:hypothetical protein
VSNIANDPHQPYEIDLRGERITLTDDEAQALYKRLSDQIVNRTLAEQAAAREAGQVWIAVYWSLDSQYEETCYSLEEAVEFLDGGQENGTLSSDSIRCPDGTVYTRADLSGDGYWSDILETKATDAR